MRLLIVFYFLTMGTAVLAQQKISQTDSTAIVSLLKEQESAWNKGDIPEFMEAYWKSDSLAFVGSGGPIFGWKSTEERYYRTYPDVTAMGQLTFTVIKIQQVNPGVVQVIGRYDLKRTIGDLSGYFTLIWRKFDEGWLIISDHTSASE